MRKNDRLRALCLASCRQMFGDEGKVLTNIGLA